MCFKRLVLNVCSLSVALNENGKLLNLVETAYNPLQPAFTIVPFFQASVFVLFCPFFCAHFGLVF